MKHLTLGAIRDALRELKEADQRVEDCKQALLHGGNEDTMNRKREALRDAEDAVTRLLLRKVEELDL